MTKTNALRAAAVLLAALLLSGCAAYQEAFDRLGALSGSEPATQTAPKPTIVPAPAEKPDAPDIPAGYTDAYSGLAFKWLDQGDPEFDCSFYDVCTVLKVYAYTSCPSLVYVAANELNSNGTVVDFANDTLSALGQGQYGILTLGSMNADVESFQLTEMNCY